MLLRDRAIAKSRDNPLPQHRSHPRDWRRNLYVYPVISRRSSGLSIGINLSPDRNCNFNCVYCQVDRSTAPLEGKVDPDRLAGELSEMIAVAESGELFKDARFAGVPTGLRGIKDIAFSGDGEPTASPHFCACVELTAVAKCTAGLDETRIVLITNAAYLARPEVEAGLSIMDANNGEVWAKLDAGTEALFRNVNRAGCPLQHIVDNIIAAARVRAIVIQSLFMRIDDRPPDDEELTAYVARLNEIVAAGGMIRYVQAYTVARRPAQSCVTPLSDGELDGIAQVVRDGTGLRADAFYSA